MDTEGSGYAEGSHASCEECLHLIRPRKGSTSLSDLRLNEGALAQSTAEGKSEGRISQRSSDVLRKGGEGGGEVPGVKYARESPTLHTRAMVMKDEKSHIKKKKAGPAAHGSKVEGCNSEGGASYDQERW